MSRGDSRGKVSAEIALFIKPAVASELIGALRGTSASPGLVVADAGYGVNSEFRGTTHAVPAGSRPQSGALVASHAQCDADHRGHGEPRKGLGRRHRGEVDESERVGCMTEATTILTRADRTVTGREGTNILLFWRFAAVRVRSAYRDCGRADLPPEQWLLIERPHGEPEPTKYFLSTLSMATPVKELARLAKLRCRIERDYQERMQELGFGKSGLVTEDHGIPHNSSPCGRKAVALVALRDRRGVALSIRFSSYWPLDNPRISGSDFAGLASSQSAATELGTHVQRYWTPSRSFPERAFRRRLSRSDTGGGGRNRTTTAAGRSGFAIAAAFTRGAATATLGTVDALRVGVGTCMSCNGLTLKPGGVVEATIIAADVD